METRKGSIWWDSHHPCAKARPQCQTLPALGGHPNTHLSSSTRGRASELCRAWLPECRLAVGRKKISQYAKKANSSPLTKPAKRMSPIQAGEGALQMFGCLLAAAGMWLDKHFQLHRASSKLLQESPLIFKTLLFLSISVLWRTDLCPGELIPREEWD